MDDPRVQAILDGMDRSAVLGELVKRHQKRKLLRYKPYGYQTEFHEAGAHYPERMLRAGNRVGKTFSACAEDAYHLTGLYPDWWTGKVFKYAPKGWIVSITNETSRDILQAELVGTASEPGLIPEELIIEKNKRQAGIDNVLESIYVQHASGNVSVASFKNYEQGKSKFQGAAIDFVHMDEEPDDIGIYLEARMRIITRNGTIYSTLTPLKGETMLMERFSKAKDGTFMITASMLEAPHLNAKEIEVLMASYPEYEREARMNGTPVMGIGRVFNFPESDVLVPPEELPKHWARICGIDFGINEDHQQAAAWLAHDRDTDTIYLYDEYKAANSSVIEHAAAIKARGKWIPVAWPHDGGHREKGSGKFLKNYYFDEDVGMLGLSSCYKSDKQGPQPVEPIVNEMIDRIKTGRFKVFPHCRMFRDEFRSLHRDKHGKIVAKKDDVMKATMYALMMKRYAATEHTNYISAPSQPIMSMWGS